jgi:hypothetical protein
MQEDLAKFGYRPGMKVENSRNPFIFYIFATMVPAYGMVLVLPTATHIYTISTSLQHTFFHSEFICYDHPSGFLLPQATRIIVTTIIK